MNNIINLKISYTFLLCYFNYLSNLNVKITQSVDIYNKALHRFETLTIHLKRN